MEQNRQDSNTQQQNVHLHMHQVVCGCHGNIYPTPTYYQTVSYRSPPPPLVPYTPQQLTRPFLQHYQYTQFNQYSVPVPSVASSSTTSVYSPANQSEIFGASCRERRDRCDNQEDPMESEKPNESSGYDYGHVSPPPNKELFTSSEENVTENFVKYLERSCITAEQIAHRNRNRPCFRNIQNLCIRTRSEILKPCTTVSNIHSQGIPWATKDFIYAFVRLTNCWHILRGYWENRDGSAIGKITKELTPEFRECYIRWEKETMELAAQLTNIFYNLDTNLNTPLNTGIVHAANNLIPSQVNILKTAEFAKKATSVETLTTTSLNISSNATTFNSSSRGLIHLPSTTETVDQANQTCTGDFYSKPEVECLVIENSEDEGETNRVYMKPGSYSVPKRAVSNNAEAPVTNGSPRTIEFLDTAQNVNKVMEAASDRYWTNVQSKKILAKQKEEIEHSQFNVQKWLITSQFSDYDNTSTRSSSPPNIVPYFVDQAPNQFGDLSSSNLSTADISPQKSSYTVLQREKNQTGLSQSKTHNGKVDMTLRNYRRKSDVKKGNKATYEDKMGGLTDTAIDTLEKIISELRTTEFTEYLVELKVVDQLPATNLDLISSKLRNRQYKYVNEVIRDIYYIVNFYSMYYGNFVEMDTKIDTFVRKLHMLLEARFAPFDFSNISGIKDEIVGPLKLKCLKYDGDGDHLN